MKRLYTCIIAFALAGTSCNEWLDIDPALEIREGQIFTSQQGFMDILTGAYIRVATPSLYGLNTTVMLPELMAQHWSVTANTSSAYISNFDFEQTAVKNLLETIWLQYYQTIVNLNALLNAIDEQKELFAAGNYNLTKGEALGLRAFLHFEVLRLWGAAPAGIVPGEKAIPYVTEVSKKPDVLLSLTYEQVFAKIIADLDAAEALLADDPVRHYSNAVLNSIGTLAGVNESLPHPADENHYFRQVRFNYYAVKATRARLHAWRGDIERAAEIALEIINAKDDDGVAQFTLGNESAANNGQLTFPSEHIFAVSNSLALQTLTPAFLTNTSAYTQTVAAVQLAYESAIHASDIRYRNNRTWEDRVVPLQTSNFNYFKKYNSTSTTVVTDMPVIRLAEMYFIAIEAGHVELFRDYRVARGMDATVDGSLDLVGDDVEGQQVAIRERLEKEYRKEFYGEGQMHFFYKRLNYDRFTWPAVKENVAAHYGIPLPQSQFQFE
ncbi:MAG: RagB/SusD family nutrient uptake outer membrane protein [Odoribacteraceae bacterium]|jgi:hypothetical protein|nr:RagB/SusD family nutrient uptake outer membrane protein [Odoribacteraceae bacterium]